MNSNYLFNVKNKHFQEVYGTFELSKANRLLGMTISSGNNDDASRVESVEKNSDKRKERHLWNVIVVSKLKYVIPKRSSRLKKNLFTLAIYRKNIFHLLAFQNTWKVYIQISQSIIRLDIVLYFCTYFSIILTRNSNKYLYCKLALKT